MTSRPGTIAHEIKITTKRPRSLFVKETIAVRERVLEFLQYNFSEAITPKGDQRIEDPIFQKENSIDQKPR